MSEETKNAAVNAEAPAKEKVGIKGYLALVIGIIYFSGILTNPPEALPAWLAACDFANLTGVFGKIITNAGESGIKFAANFRGSGGSGARDAFLFALTLLPSLMLALGSVEVIEHLGGLKAGEVLLTPVLRPLIGIPGICGLCLITSLQSTDGGAGMVKVMVDNGQLTEKERMIFIMWQFTGDGTITNWFGTAAAYQPMLSEFGIGMVVPFLIILLLKTFAANVMRFYVHKVLKEV